jgi:hypothetical protein
MNASVDQLRRLRVQAGLGADPPRTATTAANELRSLVARHRPRPPHAADRELPGVEIAPGLRCIERRIDWCPAPASILVAADRSGATLQIERGRVLVFDTETTGLAGGSGTRAFMIGAADWHDGALRLRQLLISTLAAEAAMLEQFARWCRHDAVLVSYNGKCYDAPLLATRYRLARRDNPLAGLAHLDLLHPARRRWRGVYENCRLATIERQVLGVLREDDLPGSEAPAAWLSYLRGGSAANLRRVVTHNATDLTSLAALLLRMSEQ